MDRDKAMKSSNKQDLKVNKFYDINIRESGSIASSHTPIQMNSVGSPRPLIGTQIGMSQNLTPMVIDSRDGRPD